MDLGAYAQIENLGKIAKENGIYVDRLRGYRLMAVEKKIDIEKSLEEIKNDIEVDIVSEWIGQDHRFNQGFSTYDEKHRKEEKYYIGTRNKGKENEYQFVKWERFNEEDAKTIRKEIDKYIKNYVKQWKMFNKYAGRKDVLYIHARLGAGNWRYYDCNKTVKDAPWYLDHIFDTYDCTYVDIYAKIKEVQL